MLLVQHHTSIGVETFGLNSALVGQVYLVAALLGVLDALVQPRSVTSWLDAAVITPSPLHSRLLFFLELLAWAQIQAVLSKQFNPAKAEPVAAS